MSSSDSSSTHHSEDQCIFCKIMKGQLPVSKVLETDHLFAFMDIQPVNYGHVLIIPKIHITDMDSLFKLIQNKNNLQGEELQRIESLEAASREMFPTATKIAQALRMIGEEGKIQIEGVNLFLADGESAGQEVFHMHLHVFPRFKGDGFALKIKYPKKPERSDLNILAEEIQSKLLVEWIFFYWIVRFTIVLP